MKLLDRHEFTNGKAFETWYLDAADTYKWKVPECDVIALVRLEENNENAKVTVMRPDEALIQARMLVDAVRRVSSGYEIGLDQEMAHAVVEERR